MTDPAYVEFCCLVREDRKVQTTPLPSDQSSLLHFVEKSTIFFSLAPSCTTLPDYIPFDPAISLFFFSPSGLVHALALTAGLGGLGALFMVIVIVVVSIKSAFLGCHLYQNCITRAT